jgi:hypothetical protein
MNTSAGKVPSADGACFVRALVGAIGRAADRLAFTPPPLPTLTLSGRHEGRFIRVAGFGTTPATLGRDFAPAHPVKIKGRPFRLSPAAGGSGFTEAGLSEELLALDGKFSLWAEFGSGRGVLATDLLSAGGLYYSWDAARGTLWFATHLGFLLTAAGQQPHYEPVGVAAMLAARAAIRGITPFRGVHRLGPAEYLWVEVAPNGGVTFARGSYAVVADELCRTARRPAPLPALLEELGALLEESVTREAYGQGTALMLTGGLDSQCLGLALRRRPEIPVEAVTYGAGSFADLRGARYTAAALGLRHTFVPFSDWTFETYSDLIVAAGGGSIDLGTAAMLDGFSRLDERFTTMIVGLTGGALSGKRMRQPGRHDLPQLIYKTVTQSRLPLPTLFAPEMAGLAVSVEELRNALGIGTDYQKDLLTEIVVRQATWISTQFDAGELLRNVSCPFYNRNLIKFYLNLDFRSSATPSCSRLGWTRSATVRSARRRCDPCGSAATARTAGSSSSRKRC